MKYLLTLWGDESAWADWSPEQFSADMALYEAFDRDAREAGVLLGGEALQPTATATTVRVKAGEHHVTDGPFAETKEQLGGYYLLDCRDLDEAIAWAKRIPAGMDGSIEIRPIMEDPAGDTAG